MPPKIKITKEDIIQAAVELVRKNGESSLNARNIAAILNCSTQPVFSNFADMDELRETVIAAAYELYFGFLKKEAESGKYPTYKAFGMAYIRFAGDEKELFKLLFLRDRKGQGLTPTEDFEKSVDIIMNANGIPREQAQILHMEMWAFVHGIATMIATSFFTPEWEFIENMVTDMYQGARSRHLSEEKH